MIGNASQSSTFQLNYDKWTNILYAFPKKSVAFHVFQDSSRDRVFAIFNSIDNRLIAVPLAKNKNEPEDERAPDFGRKEQVLLMAKLPTSN